MAALLRRAADAIAAWPPPGREAPPLLRAAGPGFILAWQGAEYALPRLVGLAHLVILIDRSPVAVHVADLVDPSGAARTALGGVWEPEIDAAAAAAARQALPGASEADQQKLRTYLSGAGRRTVAGLESMRTSVSHRITHALRLIRRCCPAAAAHIKSRLLLGTYCHFV